MSLNLDQLFEKLFTDCLKNAVAQGSLYNNNLQLFLISYGATKSKSILSEGENLLFLL